MPLQGTRMLRISASSMVDFVGARRAVPAAQG